MDWDFEMGGREISKIELFMDKVHISKKAEHENLLEM